MDEENFSVSDDLTESSEIEMLQRGEFAPNESVNLPCTEEQIEGLRKLGRLDSDARELRRARAVALKYQIKDFWNNSTITDIETRFDADVERPTKPRGIAHVLLEASDYKGRRSRIASFTLQIRTGPPRPTVAIYLPSREAAQ